jgi:nucleotide-binding universal stress UspA family protein
MYRNILVPLDGSTFGEYALPLALTIARKSNASLQLVHVHPPLAAGYLEGAAYIDESLDDHAKQQEMLYLEQTAQKLRQLGHVPVTTRLLLGPVTEAIEAAVRDLPADLVVLTTHGRGFLGRFWLGSTTDELVRHLTIPVLLTHPEEGKPDLEHEVEVNRLVIALDGTPLAEKMLQPAMEMGRALGAEFTLLRVLQPPQPYAFPLEGGSIGQMAAGVIDQIEAMQKRVEKEAEQYLNDVSFHFREQGLKVTTRVLIDTQPGACILAEAKNRGHDMIALETHGRGGLTRLLLGSVTDKVIRGSHVPVLVHRPVKA